MSFVFLSALSKQPPSQLCYLLPLRPPPYSSAFPGNSASSKVCSDPPTHTHHHHLLVACTPTQTTSSGSCGSCTTHVLSGVYNDWYTVDHNLLTSVANASHGCSNIWSVDLLFFEASWVQAAPRLFPFYCPAYHFFFFGWRLSKEPILFFWMAEGCQANPVKQLLPCCVAPTTIQIRSWLEGIYMLLEWHSVACVYVCVCVCCTKWAAVWCQYNCRPKYNVL